MRGEAWQRAIARCDQGGCGGMPHTHNARIAQLRAHADFAKLISRTKLSQMIVKQRKRRMFSPSNVLCVVCNT